MLTKSSDVARVVHEVLDHAKPSKHLIARKEWTEIFTRVFDTPPTGDNDPRWEKLLRSDHGLGALHVAMNLDEDVSH